MTTILIALIIIAIASAFVCGAEVSKHKIKQSKLNQQWANLSRNHREEIDFWMKESDKYFKLYGMACDRADQCESALIKQTNENITSPSSTRVLRDEFKNHRPTPGFDWKGDRCPAKRPKSRAGQGRVKVRQING